MFDINHGEYKWIFTVIKTAFNWNLCSGNWKAFNRDN